MRTRTIIVIFLVCIGLATLIIDQSISGMPDYYLIEDGKRHDIMVQECITDENSVPMLSLRQVYLGIPKDGNPGAADLRMYGRPIDIRRGFINYAKDEDFASKWTNDPRGSVFRHNLNYGPGYTVVIYDCTGIAYEVPNAPFTSHSQH